jgi:uncharacterized protein YjiS (DUF1127 family)
MLMNDTIHARAVVGGTAKPDHSALFPRLAALAGSWLERHRSRRALAELDERMLRDIGLSPSEAMEESVLPFWKPVTGLQQR